VSLKYDFCYAKAKIYLNYKACESGRIDYKVKIRSQSRKSSRTKADDFFNIIFLHEKILSCHNYKIILTDTNGRHELYSGLLLMIVISMMYLYGFYISFSHFEHQLQGKNIRKQSYLTKKQ
jgi:hypothetical protein